MKTLELPSCRAYRGELILVNGDHPLREEAAGAGLAPVGAGCPPVLLDRRAAQALEKLIGELGGWETGILAVSGWRSRQEQERLYADSLRENGEAFTRRYVARPGCSEHETGLAIDLALAGEEPDLIRPHFPDRGAGRRFRQRCAAFGFIQRYPEGKEAVTGIGCEPWHFRYVGVPHAQAMSRLGLTLEEYLPFLGERTRREGGLDCSWGRERVHIALFPAGSGGDTRLRVPEHGRYTLSGDNRGGFVLTEWRRDHAG